MREKGDGGVRNHGKPVALAERYYQDGADAAWRGIGLSENGCSMIFHDFPMKKKMGFL